MVKGCTSGAGQLPARRVSGGKEDWFLPSSGELAAMARYIKTCPIGCFYHERFAFNETESAESYYWSSSQYAAAFAYSQRFSNGLDGYAPKYMPLRVRPIRSF